MSKMPGFAAIPQTRNLDSVRAQGYLRIPFAVKGRHMTDADETRGQAPEPDRGDIPDPHGMAEEAEADDHRRHIPKLAIGYDEVSRLLRAVLKQAQDRNPISTDIAERIVEGVFRRLNRRDVVERILRSEFMANVRDMQSEITEVVGIASQADIQDLKARLDDVTSRLEKLQRTLDDIVVEVEEV